MGMTSDPKKKKKRKTAKADPASEATTSPSKAKPRPVDEDLPEEKARSGGDVGSRVSAAISVVAAFVLATALNIYAAKHYVRWDLTKNGTFTLSAATKDTLHGLDEPVKIILLLSKDDPLGVSVNELLESYQGETSKLEIEVIDPDRDRVRLLEVQKRYGLLTGDAGGHTVTDAALIVVMGDRHRYIRHEDLVEVESTDDARVRPRLEQAVTGAIRGARSADKPKVCFTTGHGEPALEEGGGDGYAEVRARLLKNNYDVVSVFSQTADAPKDPLAGCKLLILAMPTEPVPKEDVAQIKKFVLGGGSTLMVVAPIPNESQTGFLDVGVDPLLALAGVKLEKDIIFEKDPAARPMRGNGETFFPKLETHAITRSLEDAESHGQSVILTIASSLTDIGNEVHPEALLKTSPKSFGKTKLGDPTDDLQSARPGDHEGPLTVAVAATRPDSKGRIVVVSGQNALIGANWTQPEMQGTAAFIENAITWLTAEESFLDIPNKPAVSVGLKLSTDTIRQTFYYVVLGIPALITAAGVFMFLSRRRRPDVAKPKAKKDAEKDT